MVTPSSKTAAPVSPVSAVSAAGDNALEGASMSDGHSTFGEDWFVTRTALVLCSALMRDAQGK